MSDAPEGWKSVCYGELMEEIHLRAGEQRPPVLSVTKTRGPMLASERFERALHSRELSNYRLAPRNHIVCDPMLLWDGSIGRQTAVELGLVSPDYRVYRPRDGADPAFLGVLVRSPGMKARYAAGARGTNVRRNRIARSDFLAIPALLPPLGEQRKIAAILASVDETIEKTEVVIAQLQVVKQAMMQELLTRGLPGRHTRFKQTIIGNIPESWDLTPLAQVATVQTGIAKGKVVGSESVAVPYLRVANVQDGFLDLTELKIIDVEASALRRYALQNGDVLFTEGGDADKLGRGCVWHAPVEPCLHQNHIFAVRTEQTRLLPQFLSYFGGSPAGKRYFLDSAKQTTNLASINSSQLRAMPIPVPSLSEQGEIIDSIQAIDNASNAEQASLAGLRQLKDALMSALLTGQVRVAPDEDMP